MSEAKRSVERVDELDKVLSIALIAMRFGEVDRATAHPDGRPESDTTHTVMLALLAAILAPRCAVDPMEAVAFALVHDLVEYAAGDTNTAFGLTAEQRKRKEQNEALALAMLREELGAESWIVQRIDEYELQEHPAARFVRYLDKVTPKLTHALNGGRALRAIGMTPELLRAKHDAQGTALSIEYGELAALFPLFHAACARAEFACVNGGEDDGVQIPPLCDICGGIAHTPDDHITHCECGQSVCSRCTGVHEDLTGSYYVCRDCAEACS